MNTYTLDDFFRFAGYTPPVHDHVKKELADFWKEDGYNEFKAYCKRKCARQGGISEENIKSLFNELTGEKHMVESE